MRDSTLHSSPGAWLKRAGAIVVLLLVMDALLFVSAGRMDWPGPWLLSALYGLFLLVFAVWATLRAPELLKERSRRAENVKGWDKLILNLYTLALLALLVVAGLDAGRFRWSEMPPPVQLAGALAMVPLGAWLLWVSQANAYLSRYARIQDDRGQQVVSTGPYRYVRHPMYAAVIPFVLCVALVLGSWWALVPGAVIVVLFVIRTALEDRMLQAELPGYVEYARRVRFRLLPGVW